jgi:hypothetical protein
MSTIPRVQAIVIPLLRTRFPTDVQIGSWVAELPDRVYPVINVRRLGGLPVDIRLLDRAVIELTVYSDASLGIAAGEQLLLDAQEALFDAARFQTVPPGAGGYIHSYRQTMGPTSFDSPYDGTFRLQSLIQLAIRPVLT